jgi:hypothetical protein
VSNSPNGDSKPRLSSIAFGNQTISRTLRPASKIDAGNTIGETHGFAPSPRDKFAIIVCNLYLKEQCCTSLRSEAAANNKD